MVQTLGELIQSLKDEHKTHSDFFNLAAARITETYKTLEKLRAEGELSPDDFAQREHELLSIIEGINELKTVLEKNAADLANVDTSQIPDEMLDRPLTPLN